MSTLMEAVDYLEHLVLDQEFVYSQAETLVLKHFKVSASDLFDEFKRRRMYDP
jgi:hypothetical protein